MSKFSLFACLFFILIFAKSISAVISKDRGSFAVNNEHGGTKQLENQIGLLIFDETACHFHYMFHSNYNGFNNLKMSSRVKRVKRNWYVCMYVFQA